MLGGLDVVNITENNIIAFPELLNWASYIMVTAAPHVYHLPYVSDHGELTSSASFNCSTNFL